MEHYYQLKYGNVTLRPLNKQDIEKLRVWRNDPHNTKYLRELPYITGEMQEKWYERYIADEDELCFAIEETTSLFRMVGSLSLYNFFNDTCSFGKILIGDSEAHGKSVGVNATKAAIKIAFDYLGIKAVVLSVYADNVAAVKTYEKAGFTIRNVIQTKSDRTEYNMIIERKDTIMSSIEKVRKIEFPQRGDERGHLVIVEGNRDIPFDIKRAFYIYGSDANVIRGQHANRESEFVLINVAGKSKVKVKDGKGTEVVYCLDRPHTGVYLPTMVWKDMYDFSPDSVLLVLASTHYDANEYIRDYDEYVKEIQKQSPDLINGQNKK